MTLTEINNIFCTVLTVTTDQGSHIISFLCALAYSLSIIISKYNYFFAKDRVTFFLMTEWYSNVPNPLFIEMKTNRIIMEDNYEIP